MSHAPECDDDHGTPLPNIDFRSPGRFPIHNPSAEERTSSAHSMLEPAPFLLGRHEEVLHSSNLAELRSHALALTRQARRTLCLLTPDLEPWLYNQHAIAEACSRLLRTHPRNRLRILLRDSTPAVRHGHALLRLARRLTSNCQIRKLSPDDPADNIGYLLVDDCGLLLRNAPQQPTAQIHYQAPGRVRQLQRQFDRAWESAATDPDLRSFLL